MSAIHELSDAVRTRRADIGLTQATVAKLSGLSRATVNAVEKGSIGDLSLKRSAKLLEVLGLQVRVDAPRGQGKALKPKSPFVIGARTASVSYRRVIDPDQLRQMLSTGQVPDEYKPHLYTLLEEASISLIASLVEELHIETGSDRALIWQRLRTLARELSCLRDVWQ
jgi:transcriptional regulator with XRE-family HTH domain